MTTEVPVYVSPPLTMRWEGLPTYPAPLPVPVRGRPMDNPTVTRWVTNQVTTTERDRVEGVAERFHQLAEQWRNETSMLSSPTETILNPAYWEIILMGLRGEPVVPLILRDLEETGDNWFFALEKITGATPPGTNGNDLDQVIEAWLDWGRANEYLA